MKIAFYNEGGKTGGIYENLSNPRWVGDTLIFDEASFTSLQGNYVLLEDEVEIPLSYDEAKTYDITGTIPKPKGLSEENEELKNRLAYLEDALLMLMDLI